MNNSIFTKGFSFLIASLCFLLIPYAYAGSSMKASSYFGTYLIHDIRNIGGSITSDSEAAKWIGKSVEIGTRKFSIRNIELLRPIYRMESIRIEKQEGNVIPKDLSIFWGVDTERTHVRRILVFEKASDRHAYEKIEVLDENSLIEIYDGRIYFLRRIDKKSIKKRAN